MGWIRMCMDPELLPGSRSGSRTWKVQSWIWIWNKSFRIHKTGFKGRGLKREGKRRQEMVMIMCMGVKMAAPKGRPLYFSSAP